MPTPPRSGPHPAIRRAQRDLLAGHIDRRGFLTRATALGLGAGAAYGLLGLAAPAPAQSRQPRRGGRLRIQMNLHPQKDPRRWDWPELANLCRGWLEYLVEYQPDGSLAPRLLYSWEVSQDARHYTWNLRRGVHWNNGDRFTAADVVHNLERWCDGTVAGNSMAARMGALRDPDTRKMRADAVELLDDHSLRLHLSRPDIALMVNASDYPAAIVHPSFNGDDPVGNPLGTGPYLPVAYEPGVAAHLVRNPDHDWWGGADGAYLDEIRFVDLGTDPSRWFSALRDGEIDMLDETAPGFVDSFDTLDLQRSETLTASTLCIRFNQRIAPYDNRALRRATQLAVDNAVVLELGYENQGTVAENHHVSPLHPEYAELPPPETDPARALIELRAEGLEEHVFDLISVDESWQASSCDAVAAQLQDAGLRVRRRNLPSQEYLAGWAEFPFSATSWLMRPLGVQVLDLAYRSDAAWNETGFANEEFDGLLDQASRLIAAEERRVVMARLQDILQREGVMVQPYWRRLFRHARRDLRGAQMHPMHELHLLRYWLDDPDTAPDSSL